MTKIEFLNRLKDKLQGLPESEITERLNFYAEMIDDKIEDGIPEETAVKEVGNFDDIVAQILGDYSILKLATQKFKSKRRLTSSEIALVSVGSIVWFPLLFSAIAIIFSLYVSVWAVIVFSWAIFGGFIATSIACLPLGILYLILGFTPSGLFIFSACMVLSGLSIFTFFGCKYLTKITILLTKMMSLNIKNRLIKKENAQ